LISEPSQIDSSRSDDSDLFFEIPNNMSDQYNNYVTLFQTNRDLIPWFPAILIGEGFELAVEFLEQIQPNLIVTNNSGIAFESFSRNIKWIAGPQFNVTNSLTLDCLAQQFGCIGSFISNELNRSQIAPIKKPESFKLYYSIYHPIVLMTSRMCLLLNVIDCGKSEMDFHCESTCQRHATIVNELGKSLFIDKQRGNLNTLYNDQNYLNTEIISDLPDMFDSFCIDLRPRSTATSITTDFPTLIHQFKAIIRREPESASQIHTMISHSTLDQYRKGI